MQHCRESVSRVLPKGYVLKSCTTKDGPCGCLTALKESSKAVMPVCKIHGDHGHEGTEQNLNKLRENGYIGPVFTQFPVFEEGSKNVSRNNGRFSSRPQRLDMLLCAMTTSKIAAIQVKGVHRGGAKAQAKHGKKVDAVDGFEDCLYVELEGKKSNAKGKTGSGQEAHAQSPPELEPSARVGSKRPRTASSKVRETVSHQDSIFAEIVNFLR